MLVICQLDGRREFPAPCKRPTQSIDLVERLRTHSDFFKPSTRLQDSFRLIILFLNLTRSKLAKIYLHYTFEFIRLTLAELRLRLIRTLSSSIPSMFSYVTVVDGLPSTVISHGGHYLELYSIGSPTCNFFQFYGSNKWYPTTTRYRM